MLDLKPNGTVARIANPSLLPLAILIGSWRTTGTHPMRPGRVLHGRTSFNWLEEGAFLIVRSHIDDPDFPDGVAIIGSDNIARTFNMSYFDERGVSRLFDVAITDRSITWRRYDQQLRQCNTIVATEDGRTLVSTGRMSEAGGTWGDDLSQTFYRDDGQ